MADRPIAAHSERDPALEGLRAVAVLVVVAFHCRVPGFSGGFFGVDLFFVLSGFLITRLLVAEWAETNAISLPRFYWNRLVRLSPPLILVLLVVGTLGIVPVRELAVAALYLGDIYFAASAEKSLVSHTWSLAVEEHYYLAWPLVLPFVMRSRNPARTVLALYLAFTLWRTIAWQWAPGHATYYRFDARLTGLLLGSALALAPLRLSPAIQRMVAIFATLVLSLAIGASTIFTAQSMLVTQPMVELAAAAIIHCIVQPDGAGRELLSARPLVYIGKLSYVIYLVHYPIAATLRETHEWPVVLAVALGLSLLAAAAMRVAVEVPSRRFRSEAPARLVDAPASAGHATRA